MRKIRERFNKISQKRKSGEGDRPSQGAMRENSSFRCSHCHTTVMISFVVSRVRNRNHCPYCLWSRHVDSNRAGDRLAACKATMKPIGLTLKRTHKKYDSAASGELMLIHQCTGCRKISINRIAADDDTDRMIDIFNQSLLLDQPMREILDSEGITLLGKDDFPLVKTRLYGNINQ